MSLWLAADIWFSFGLLTTLTNRCLVKCENPEKHSLLCGDGPFDSPYDLVFFVVPFVTAAVGETFRFLYHVCSGFGSTFWKEFYWTQTPIISRTLAGLYAYSKGKIGLKSDDFLSVLHFFFCNTAFSCRFDQIWGPPTTVTKLLVLKLLSQLATDCVIVKWLPINVFSCHLLTFLY